MARVLCKYKSRKISHQVNTKVNVGSTRNQEISKIELYVGVSTFSSFCLSSYIKQFSFSVNMFKTHNTQSEALDTIVGTRTSFCCANQPPRKIKCTVALPKNDCDKRINKLENSSFTPFLLHTGKWISAHTFLSFSVRAHHPPIITK